MCVGVGIVGAFAVGVVNVWVLFFFRFLRGWVVVMIVVAVGEQ